MKSRAALLLGLALNVFVDVVVAALLVNYIAPYSGESWLITAIFVAIAWAAQLYGAMKAAVIALAVKNEGGAKALAAQLAQEGFPAAQPHDDADRYLARLAGDAAHDTVRDRAIFYRGEIAGFNSAAGLARSFALARTWDRAIQLIR